jgi:hypothetical protein
MDGDGDWRRQAPGSSRTETGRRLRQILGVKTSYLQKTSQSP